MIRPHRNIPDVGIPDILDELWKLMFHAVPHEHKPPMEVSFVGDTDENSPEEIKDPSIQIYMALAGFKPDDIQIKVKNRTLFISGDNTYNDEVPDKFKIKFERVFPCKDTVDLNSVDVSFDNAILIVTLPFIQPQEDSFSIWP